MSGRIGTAAISLWYILACAGVVGAQGRGGVNWTTAGNDAQRSSWVRTDPKISADSLRAHGFQFLWKIKLDNDSRQLNSLTPMIILDPYTGFRGHKSLGFLSGSSDNVFGIDTDLGIVEWHDHFSSGLKPQSGSGLKPRDGNMVACPGGMTSPVARPTSLVISTAPAGRGGGARGGPARSSVFDAGQEPVTLQPPAPAPSPARNRAAAVPAAPAARVVARPNAVYAITSDGMLQTMYVSNGADAEPPARFLPPGANALGLIVVDNVAYTETAQGCGGAANGVWALDLISKEITSWESKSGGGAGTAGPAFGPDGTLYVTGSGDSPATSNILAALAPKSLKLMNWFASKQEFVSSPVVFQFQDKTLLAAASADQSIYLLDSARMGGADHQTALHKTPSYSGKVDFIPGALASWQDSSGTRWVLAPAAGPAASGAGFTATNGAVTNGAIVAWKVADHNGTPSLEPGWVSRDMTSPLTPIIVNGVIFAVSSGEYRTNDSTVTAAQRKERSVRAVLYALDAATGKELWSSGDTVTSFVHSGGLSAGGSQIYLATHDGTLYAFGFPIEH
jgi:outer membrane protein assembly factor BamB